MAMSSDIRTATPAISSVTGRRSGWRRHLLAALVRAPEVALHGVTEPAEVADRQRVVEAEVGPDLGDGLGRDAAGAEDLQRRVAGQQVDA
jgi:hypothetical protein